MNFFSQYSVLNSCLNKNKTIGLVPTMGALHEGHISLIERATIENEQVIVTIFVNHTKFENSEEIKFKASSESIFEKRQLFKTAFVL